jgi:hypothetical protein
LDKRNPVKLESGSVGYLTTCKREKKRRKPKESNSYRVEEAGKSSICMGKGTERGKPGQW